MNKGGLRKASPPKLGGEWTRLYQMGSGSPPRTNGYIFPRGARRDGLVGGVSGRLFDKHCKDQIESFTNGNKVYWWFSDEAIKANCRNTLVLNP